MSEWKEYTGSHEQLDEMRQSAHGFVARNASSVSSIMSVKLNQLFLSGQKDPYLPELFGNKVSEFLNYNNTTHYLICNPHQLADMICQQARTGQPVYIRLKGFERFSPVLYDKYWFVNGYSVVQSTTPNWNIPKAEYSFSPFEKDIEFKEEV